MTAKRVSIGDSLTGGVVVLQKQLKVFEEVCMDENFRKLFNELNKRGQSSIHKSDYLDSLTNKYYSLIQEVRACALYLLRY